MVMNVELSATLMRPSLVLCFQLCHTCSAFRRAQDVSVICLRSLLKRIEILYPFFGALSCDSAGFESEASHFIYGGLIPIMYPASSYWSVRVAEAVIR